MKDYSRLRDLMYACRYSILGHNSNNRNELSPSMLTSVFRPDFILSMQLYFFYVCLYAATAKILKEKGKPMLLNFISYDKFVNELYPRIHNVGNRHAWRNDTCEFGALRYNSFPLNRAFARLVEVMIGSLYTHEAAAVQIYSTIDAHTFGLPDWHNVASTSASLGNGSPLLKLGFVLAPVNRKNMMSLIIRKSVERFIACYEECQPYKEEILRYVIKAYMHEIKPYTRSLYAYRVSTRPLHNEDEIWGVTSKKVNCMTSVNAYLLKFIRENTVNYRSLESFEEALATYMPHAKQGEREVYVLGEDYTHIEYLIWREIDEILMDKFYVMFTLPSSMSGFSLRRCYRTPSPSSQYNFVMSILTSPDFRAMNIQWIQGVIDAVRKHVDKVQSFVDGFVREVPDFVYYPYVCKHLSQVLHDYNLHDLVGILARNEVTWQTRTSMILPDETDRNDVVDKEQDTQTVQEEHQQTTVSTTNRNVALLTEMYNRIRERRLARENA